MRLSAPSSPKSRSIASRKVRSSTSRTLLSPVRRKSKPGVPVAHKPDVKSPVSTPKRCEVKPGQKRLASLPQPASKKTAKKARVDTDLDQAHIEFQDDSDDDQDVQMEWVAPDLNTPHRFSPFSGSSGGMVLESPSRHSGRTPLDYFKLYFTDGMMAKMAEWSNDGLDEQPDVSFYTTDSVLLGIACCIYLGVEKPRRLKHVWSRNPCHRRDVIASVVTRQWFQFFLSNLRYGPRMKSSDETKAARDADKAYAIRPLLEMLRERCVSVFTPGEFLCVDECMVATKHHCGFIQYNKDVRSCFFHICSCALLSNTYSVCPETDKVGRQILCTRRREHMHHFQFFHLQWNSNVAPSSAEFISYYGKGGSGGPRFGSTIYWAMAHACMRSVLH